MTEFEQQVAEALRDQLFEHSDVYETQPGAADEIVATLAPRVAAAINTLNDQYIDVFEDWGGAAMIGGSAVTDEVYDAADARRSLERLAIEKLRGQT